ncbi:hypothetical protein CHH52_15040 [Shouchella clausii]|nr:hypothetical protein CHH52_15040 [Shouchella clausii]
MNKEGLNLSKDTKEQIFLNARCAFSQFGYKHTSLEQIARMSGTGKSTIYHYVSSKRSLFKQIISEEIEHNERLVDEFLSSNPKIEEISNFLHYYRENHLNSVLIDKIIHESKQIGTTEAFEELARLEENNHLLMRRILEHFNVKKDDEDLSILAFLIVEIYNLLSIKWAETNKPLNKEKTNDIISTFIKTNLK